MLLIVGGARDPEALAAVSALGPDRAVLSDATDLSRPGWNLHADRPAEGNIVAGGRPLSVSRLTGVLVRRLAVYPQELAHVHEADRDYVASEMTALLTWWLHAVPIPVVNRPAAGVLCGPGWRLEQWRAQAARMGYPVVDSIRSARPAESLPTTKTEVVVVGDNAAGHPPAHLADRVIALARAGNAPMLSASFGEEDLFLGAHPMPRLAPNVLAALTKHIRLSA